MIHFSRNFGHQPAVTAGINHCDADLAVILDADMQDPPELIAGMLELQEKENANVVYCVRKSREGESFFKKITSKAFYRLLNYMSDVSFPLDTGDFRMIDRKIMDQFDRFQERGKYIRGLISWLYTNRFLSITNGKPVLPVRPNTLSARCGSLHRLPCSISPRSRCVWQPASDL